jgi:hypothetical protein
MMVRKWRGAYRFGLRARNCASAGGRKRAPVRTLSIEEQRLGVRTCVCACGITSVRLERSCDAKRQPMDLQ